MKGFCKYSESIENNNTQLFTFSVDVDCRQLDLFIFNYFCFSIWWQRLRCSSAEMASEEDPRWSPISVSNVSSPSQATTSWCSTSGERARASNYLKLSRTFEKNSSLGAFQSSHGWEAVQMFVLWSQIQTTVSRPAAHEAPHRYGKIFR